jgi:NAD(P)-dependent dehydrogenase (short-subunit alcohol dehydrogenase family)
MDLNGSRALVTGGASGLGKATAQTFADRGAEVFVLDLPDAEQRFEAAPGLTFVAADVRDPDQVEAAVSAAAGDQGLRVCVNCAGLGTPRRVATGGVPMPLEEFTRTIDVNLVGTFNVIRLAAASMQGNEPIDGERGVIISTASVAAFEGQIGQAAYSASKGGIVALTIAVARDLASSLIRCMTIAPGLFETPLLATLSEEVRKSLGDSVPHPRRLGQPSEYAQLAADIVANPMLNGEVIRLDGGIRMAPR